MQNVLQHPSNRANESYRNTSTVTSETPAILDALLGLDRTTTWHLTATTPIESDLGHPQGLSRCADSWMISTVHSSSRRGEILLVDDFGTPTRQRDLTDGKRIHPGGIHCSSPRRHFFVAVAEYRPVSTTTVLCLDATFEILHSFFVDDHLGAVCELEDGTLFAVSWGSRTLYRLAPDGEVLERRRNPSHFIDYQDLCVIGPNLVLASGVADNVGNTTSSQLGGVAILDMSDLRTVHESPIFASMPSGRSITYNGFHVAERNGTVSFHCLVDDDRAAIGHWTTS